MIEEELTDALEKFVKAVTEVTIEGVKPPEHETIEYEARRALIDALDRYIEEKIAAHLPA